MSLFVQVLQVLPIVLWKKLPRGLIDPFNPEVQRMIRLKNLILQRAIFQGNPVIQIQAKTALLTLSPILKAPLVQLLLTEAHAAGLLKTEIVIVNYNKYLPDYFYKTNINGEK